MRTTSAVKSTVSEMKCKNAKITTFSPYEYDISFSSRSR